MQLSRSIGGRPGQVRDVALAVGVFIFATVALILLMPRDIGIYDEGIVLTSSIRMMNGDLIHRDFYSTYGPAQYFVVSEIFKIFGVDFLASRVYDIITRSAIISTAFLFLLRRSSISWALLGAGTIFLWAVSCGTYTYTVFPCLLLSLVGTWLMVDVATRPALSMSTFAAGVCAGLTALFRYDVGFFVAAANLVAAGAVLVCRPGGGQRLAPLVQTVLVYGVGTSLVFLPPAVWFVLNSPLQPFYSDIIELSFKYYAAMRGLPFPGAAGLADEPSQIAVYLPPVALLLVGARLAQRTLRGARPAGDGSDKPVDSTALLVAFGSLTAFFFLKGVVRVSTMHMLLAVVPASMLCVLLAAQAWRQRRVQQAAAVALMMFVAGPPLIMAVHDVGRSLRTPQRSFGGWLAVRGGLLEAPAAAKCELGPASGIARLPADYANAARYIARHTSSDERILVAVGRHDKIFVNPTSLYFATGRLPASRWHQFDPGIQTRADVQTAMVAELERGDVRWVVRDASFDDVIEPNQSAISSEVRILDDYLDRRYRRAIAYGKVAIWLRDGEAIPVAAAASANAECP